MTRQFAFLLCIVLCVLLVGASTFQAAAADPAEGLADIGAPTVVAVAESVSSAVPSVPFGVNLSTSSPTALQLAREAGARWAKTGISWASVEPTDVDLSNTANGNWPDSWIQTLVDNGLAPMILIWKNPSWAAATSCGPLNTGMLSEFAEFLAALVARYSQPPYNIKHWELYNEPDIKDAALGDGFGGCWGNNGAQYAQMLAVADAAIHGADPEAKIILGSLAYEWWNGDFFKSGIDPTISPGPTEWTTSGNEFPDFLETVLSNGGGDHFDIMGFHDYIVFHPRWDRPDDGSLPGDQPYQGCTGRPQEGDILGKLIYLRKRLMKHDAAYGNKPFAVTEIGRRSDSGQPMLQQSCLGGSVPGSDEQQSRYAVQGNVRALAAGLEIAIWFDLIDLGTGEYGLLDASLNPKPAYWAYKTTTSELEGYQYVKQLSSSETSGHTDVEAYLFESSTGNQKWVLWTPTKVSGETTRQVSFPVEKIRVVPKQKYNDTYPDVEIPGVVQIISDGGPGDLDGVLNGQVAINVSASPIFVQDFTIPDYCLSKPTDLDPVPGNGISLDDITAVANSWREKGTPGNPHPYDFNGDGRVGVDDIEYVAQWLGCL